MQLSCRLKLQQHLSNALSVELLVVQDPTYSDPSSVIAHLFVGQPDTDVDAVLSASTSRSLAMPPPTGPIPTDTDQPTYVRVVALIENMPRSFKEMDQQIRSQVKARTAVYQASQRRLARRQLLQLDSNEADESFVLVSLNTSALPVCGNSICEFGEATGTFAYPETWFCAEDCPFVLNACPQQVRMIPELQIRPQASVNGTDIPTDATIPISRLPCHQFPACVDTTRTLSLQDAERIGEPGEPCGRRGQCALTSGTCGCFQGYAGSDCGECARGYVRVLEQCSPFFSYEAVSWYSSWLRWVVPLLLLLLLCCCCIAIAAARRRRRLRLQLLGEEQSQGRFIAHVRDLLALPSNSIRKVHIQQALMSADDFLRPDRIMQGNAPHRSSVTGSAEALPSADSRMRQLTMGNYTWPGRRAASMDGSHAHPFLEMYSDGRQRATSWVAYNGSIGSSLGGPHGIRSLLLQSDETDEPRSVLQDGLMVAEGRSTEDTSGALLGLSMSMRARRHLQRLMSDDYCLSERKAALAATLVMHEDENDSTSAASESILSLLLRERCVLRVREERCTASRHPHCTCKPTDCTWPLIVPRCDWVRTCRDQTRSVHARRTRFQAESLDSSHDSHHIVTGGSAANSGSVRQVLLTRASEQMHRQLATQSRDDAHAYLAMLHDHDSIRSEPNLTSRYLSLRSGQPRGVAVQHAEAGATFPPIQTSRHSAPAPAVAVLVITCGQHICTIDTHLLCLTDDQVWTERCPRCSKRTACLVLTMTPQRSPP
jgi:hypothetical protein